MPDDSQLELDFHQVKDLMQETADNLKRIRENMNRMRWQFGGTDLKEFEELSREVDSAINGWMSSVC
jgi:hypothetical protein